MLPSGCTILHAPQQGARIPNSPLFWSIFLIIAIQGAVKWHLTVVLISTSPVPFQEDLCIIGDNALV